MNSTFSITPSLPTNGLSGPMAYNHNYFPNTDIPLQGPVFWERMIQETKKASSIKLFLFELKPYGAKSSRLWFEALLERIPQTNVKAVFQPVCDPAPNESCIKEWWNCERDNCPDSRQNQTSNALLKQMKDAGADIYPMFVNSLFPKMCSDFSSFNEITNSTTEMNICESIADLHTKIFIFDDETFYIGSANTDEAAAHEMGIWITDRTMAQDVVKHFNLCFDLAKGYVENGTTLQEFQKSFTGETIPEDELNQVLYHNPKWPEKYKGSFNTKNPYTVLIRNETPNSVDENATSYCKMYLSISPMALCTTFEWDYVAWMNVINGATKTLFIASFDLSPTLFTPNHDADTKQDSVCSSMAGENNWPFCTIFSAIEDAVYRGVDVRIIGGTGFPHRGKDYLVPWGKKVNERAKALLSEGTVSVSFWPTISYLEQAKPMNVWPTLPPAKLQLSQWTKEGKWNLIGNVLHDKFIVTDKSVLMSTNNASGTYFNITNGASLVIETDGQLRDEVQNQFNAMWYGPFSGARSFPNQNCQDFACTDEDTLIAYKGNGKQICNGVVNPNPPYVKGAWFDKPFFCQGSCCNGHGSCSNGQCICEDGWTSEDCSQPKTQPKPQSSRLVILIPALALILILIIILLLHKRK